MIVVDLGCATYPEFPEDESVNRLLERFRPDVLYGFDPNRALVESDRFDGHRVVLERKAAWVYDGFVGYVMPPAVLNPLRCFTAEEAGPEAVPCFDLARFLRDLPDDEIVLKLDCEGAEYPLLEHLVETDTDELLELVLVEWHGDDDRRRDRLVDLLLCRVEEWA